MPASADRNLLFGVLALQMEFITQAGLIAAMQTWTLQKSRPLGELLVELGHMSAEDRAALDPMVDRHVAKHGGSAEQSLAALSSVSEIAASLGPVEDADLQQTLKYLGGRRLQDASNSDSPDRLREQPQQQRFELLRAHAEGGLGKVWIANDRELNREVAFKEIKPGHAQDSGSRGRFVLEAEITGGLEHPGIVPIYSLGHHENGRPFYAMRFIRGDSLKEAIQQFHSPVTPPATKSDPNSPTVIGQAPIQDPVATVARPWDAADAASPRSGERGYGSREVSSERFTSVEFRQLLGRFVDVCNAIEYAHSRGVLHRDLKPGNIMLGKYGETLVVDWGLAKATGKADQFADSAEATLRPSSGSSIEQTADGSVIGTPAYMSPEQAAGRLDELGPATDVYSLGATLYHILTGQPPFGGGNVAEIVRRVQAGEFRRPREVANQFGEPEGVSSRTTSNSPGADALRLAIPLPLEAICLKAMSLRPSARYSSTAALAVDVERFLADEPVSAHAEPLLIRARRWIKRHQTLVGSTAAAVLVATVTLSVLTVVVSGKNAALQSANATIAQANTSLAQANTDLEKANAAERAAKSDADQKRIAADQARDETKQAFDFLVAAFRKSDPSQDGEKLTVAEMFDQAAEQLETTFPSQPLIQAELLNAIGSTYQGLGLFEKAVAIFERSRDMHRQVRGENHRQTLNAEGNLASAYQAAGRLAEALPLLETTLKSMQNTLGSEDPDTLRSMNSLASAYVAAGRLAEALPLYERSLEQMRVQLGPEHADTLAAMNNLAFAYKSVARLAEALPLYEESLEVMQTTLGPEHPRTLISMNNLAGLFTAMGRDEEAVRLHQRTLELRKTKLGPEHPDTLMSTNNLANAYRNVGRLKDALPLLEQTLELKKAKLGVKHPDTLTSMNNLAAAYEAAGRLTAALPLFEQTLELRKSQLGPEHPATLMSMNNLAFGYASAGKLEQALPLYERTLELRKTKLGADHPDTLTSMNNLARGYLSVGRLSEALPLFEKTLELSQAKLGAKHPDTLMLMGNLARAYFADQQPEKALPLTVRFLAAQRERAAPDDPAFASRLAAVSVDLLLYRQYPAAETYLRECLAIREKNLADDWVVYNTKSLLGGALAGQKKFQEAEPLLVEGYSGMKEREAKIPPTGKTRLNESVQRLMDFYTAWDKPDEAAKWRAKLEAPKSDSK